jgi:hypothetical protein
MVIDCPYCSAENTTFLFQAGYHTKEAYWMFFQCPRCLSGVAAKGFPGKFDFSERSNGDVHSFFDSIDHFPKRLPVEAPDGLTLGIKRLYLQAAECLRRDNLDGASMLLRKTLEVALREKFGAMPGNLSQRIRQLRERHLLTDELAAWANEIRIDGNEAAHDAEEPDRENARQMKEFLHVFLLHTFTLPAMIKARHKTG